MMTRSTTRNILLLLTLALIGGTLFMKNQNVVIQNDTQSVKNAIARLRTEQKQASQVSTDIALLDKRTMNEKEATRLGILRYLGLEESDLVYSTRAVNVRRVAGTNLYTRSFSIQGQMAYGDALERLDAFNASEKIVIDRVVITPGEGYGDVVNIEIGGVFYGLDKK